MVERFRRRCTTRPSARTSTASREPSPSSASWRCPKRARRALAGRDDRCAARARRQDRSGEAQPLVARQLDLAELVPDHEPVRAVKLRLAHQRLDVDAVPEVGRHAAGAGVRMLQQAHRLELGHRRANGRRADAHAPARDEVLGANRGRVEDVVLDHGAQHRPLPLGQLADRPLRRKALVRGHALDDFGPPGGR